MITDTLPGKSARKDGAIVAADFDFKAVSRAEFFTALLTEVTFPSLDAAAKDPAYMTLKFAPEHTTVKAAGGQLESPPRARSKTAFVFDADGLDGSAVTKI